jgi:hypothetical protein
MLRAFVITSVMFASGVTSVAYAQGSLDIKKAKEALDLISETAERICYIVPLNGETQSSEVQGQIGAELSVLLSKLVRAGVSAAGKITKDEYTNLSQKDLPPIVLKHQDCRLKVFESLRTTLLVIPPGSTTSYPQTPENNISGRYYGVVGSDAVTTLQGRFPRYARLELEIRVGSDGSVGGQIAATSDQGNRSGPIQGKITGDKVRIEARSYSDDPNYSVFEGRVTGNTIKDVVSNFGPEAAQIRALYGNRGLPLPQIVFEISK